jgi:hypothetical protein
MAEFREPNRVKEYLSKGSKSGNQYGGTNRRAIALLPEQGSALPGSEFPDRRQLLAAIEARKGTGCIKVISKKAKSRGALLVFQGRLMGAIYGNASIQGQLFYDQAYKYLVNDLCDPETTVTAYSLSESLVIATGALFHGQFSEMQQRGGAGEAFNASLRMLTESNMPGCVMVNDSNNVAVLSVYLFGGKIVGLYSGREGWLTPSPQEAYQQISKYSGASVRSAMLKVRSLEEALALSTSLSNPTYGEEDTTQNASPSSKISAAELAQLDKLEKDSQSSKFVNAKNKDALLERELFLREHLSHLVNP